MNCEFCNKTLSRKSSLDRHQRTSKTCLVIQGKLEAVVRSKRDPVPCVACGKTFTKRTWHEEHLRTCHALKVQQSLLSDHEKALSKQKEDIQKEHERSTNELLSKYTNTIRKNVEEISDLSYELQEAKEQLRELELRAAVSEGKLEVQSRNVQTALEQTGTTNNYNISLGELTPELGLRIAEELTHKEFWQGQPAIADAVRGAEDDDGNPMYATLDRSRHAYEVQLEGQRVRDDKGEKIIKAIEGPVAKKISAISADELRKYKDDPDQLSLTLKQQKNCMEFSDPKKNSQFRNHLSMDK